MTSSAFVDRVIDIFLTSSNGSSSLFPFHISDYGTLSEDRIRLIVQPKKSKIKSIEKRELVERIESKQLLTKPIAVVRSVSEIM